MARIHGVFIPDERPIRKGLTYIFGVGQSTAYAILEALKIDQNTKVKDLTTDQAISISSYISNHYTVEGDLRREVLSNIKALIEMKSYRGIRHSSGLTVRGQRTKNNNGSRKKTKGSSIRRKK